MKVLIMGRNEIEKMARNIFSERTALISITDVGFEFANLTYAPEFLLQVAFDDVDNDVFVDILGRRPTEEERLRIESQYHMISDEQAKAIAKFVVSVFDKVDCLICQCEHGQSRSAAVAAAILEFRSRRGISVFSHDHYYPNKVVFRKVLDALKRTIEKNEEM